jgi:hypothetical protein
METPQKAVFGIKWAGGPQLGGGGQFLSFYLKVLYDLARLPGKLCFSRRLHQTVTFRGENAIPVDTVSFIPRH